MSIFDTIKKPSSPFPETYIGFPEDQDDWSGYNFIDYFKANKKLVGQADASYYVQKDITQLHVFADIYDSDFDCFVVGYFATEMGVDYPNPLSYTYCGVEKAVISTGKAASNIGRFVTFITNPVTLTIAGLAIVGTVTYPYWKPLLKRRKRGRV